MYGQPSDELKAEILGHYQAGRGSIQDYARIYHLSVPQVLEIVGESDLGETTLSEGDQIDEAEIGRAHRDLINGPEKIDTPFSLN